MHVLLQFEQAQPQGKKPAHAGIDCICDGDDLTVVGVEGQRLMHALKQPNLPMAELAAAPGLADLGSLPDRQAVVEQRIRSAT